MIHVENGATEAGFMKEFHLL